MLAYGDVDLEADHGTNIDLYTFVLIPQLLMVIALETFTFVSFHKTNGVSISKDRYDTRQKLYYFCFNKIIHISCITT